MKYIKYFLLFFFAAAVLSSCAPDTVTEETTIQAEVTSTEETTQATEESTAHVHELATTENVPTCTEGATVISSCACGYTSNEEIPPLGHEFKDGVCTRCGEKEEVTDADVPILTESDALEAARKFWNLPSNAVLYLKEKSPSNPFCYKVAYCELTYADFIGNFEVKREVFVDQRTGECTEVVYQYPEIPEIFLDVIFNREKFLYVEQTVNSAGEYSYTATEALFKDFLVHYETIFGAQSLGYYVTDIDGDSIPELIFPGMEREKYGVLFRVYEGKIYGYACLLNGLHTDATYFWSEQAGCYSGRSQVYFDGIFYKSRRLTAKDINDPNNVIYYVEGNQTTKEKYDEAESAYSNEVLQYYILDYYPVYVNPFPGG